MAVVVLSGDDEVGVGSVDGASPAGGLQQSVDLLPLLPEIDIPVLALHGRNDEARMLEHVRDLRWVWGATPAEVAASYPRGEHLADMRGCAAEGLGSRGISTDCASCSHSPSGNRSRGAMRYP